MPMYDVWVKVQHSVSCIVHSLCLSFFYRLQYTVRRRTEKAFKAMEVPAAPATNGNENKGLKTLISLYSSCLWNRVVGFVPSSDSNFLGKIPIYFRGRSRKPRACLPLPLPSNSLQYSPYAYSSLSLLFVLLSIFKPSLAANETDGGGIFVFFSFCWSYEFSASVCCRDSVCMYIYIQLRIDSMVNTFFMACPLLFMTFYWLRNVDSFKNNEN